MKLYGGIDLHSNNNYLGIIDKKDQRVFKKKLPNDLGAVLTALKPYRKELRGLVVESTFNWYWLVDGLMENGYKVHLANPAAITQYSGLKYSDDETDSFHLALLLKMGILPEGYIYPKEQRPLRDLARKRLKFVQERTTHILSFKSMVSRNTGISIPSNEIKKMTEEDVEGLVKGKHLVMLGQANIGAMRFLKGKIDEMEKTILKEVKLRKDYKILLTAPGIGPILTLTIMLEIGDITRFSTVGDYASYCRCVDSIRVSNGKSKGEGNRKNGNKYLSWAYVEAANAAKRDYAFVRKYYQRKAAKTNNIVAIKAISHKLARATYFMIKDQEVFNPKKAFG